MFVLGELGFVGGFGDEVKDFGGPVDEEVLSHVAEIGGDVVVPFEPGFVGGVGEFDHVVIGLSMILAEGESAVEGEDGGGVGALAADVLVELLALGVAHHFVSGGHSLIREVVNKKI